MSRWAPGEGSAPISSSRKPLPDPSPEAAGALQGPLCRRQQPGLREHCPGTFSVGHLSKEIAGPPGNGTTQASQGLRRRKGLAALDSAPKGSLNRNRAIPPAVLTVLVLAFLSGRESRRLAEANSGSDPRGPSPNSVTYCVTFSARARCSASLCFNIVVFRRGGNRTLSRCRENSMGGTLRTERGT